MSVELANPETSGSRRMTRRFDVDKKWVDLKVDLLLRVDNGVAEKDRLEILTLTDLRIRAVTGAMIGSATHLGKIVEPDFNDQPLFPSNNSIIRRYSRVRSTQFLQKAVNCKRKIVVVLRKQPL
jgi:hypothetical protein